MGALITMSVNRVIQILQDIVKTSPEKGDAACFIFNPETENRHAIGSIDDTMIGMVDLNIKRDE